MLFSIGNSFNMKLFNFFHTMKSPKTIIISQNIFKTINYQVFTHFLKDIISSPVFIKESIYFPIVAIYLLNEYLNYVDKNKNLKIDKLSSENTYKLKKFINQLVFIFNIIFIKDIESVN